MHKTLEHINQGARFDKFCHMYKNVALRYSVIIGITCRGMIPYLPYSRKYWQELNLAIGP